MKWKKIRPTREKIWNCDVPENATGDFHGIVGNTGLSERDFPANIQPAGPLCPAAATTSFERTGQLRGCPFFLLFFVRIIPQTVPLRKGRKIL